MSSIFHVLAPTVIMIAGVPVPVDAIKQAPKLIQDIESRKGPAVLARDFLPVVAAGVGVANPAVGLGLTVAFWVVAHGKPMTQQDELRWMATQGMVGY